MLLLLSRWLLKCSGMEGIIQAYVGLSDKERESWVYISAYGPGSEKSEKDMDEFWNELNGCVGSYGTNESVVVVGDLNARVGNEVVEIIVGQHGVPGRNEGGERLLHGDVCTAEVVVGSGK